MSKNTEKIVLQQLFAYLTEHKLICPFHSAYCPNHSTETSPLKITNDILLAIEFGNVSLLTLLDLSAAFDSFDHCILLNRLQYVYVISGTALSWFSSYLTNRTSQSSSMTTSEESQAFPMECHRVLCWAQLSSSCKQGCLPTLQRVPVLRLAVVHNIQITGCRCSSRTEVNVDHAAIAQPSIQALPTLSYQSLLTIGIGNGPVHVLVLLQSLTGDILSLRCYCQRVVFAWWKSVGWMEIIKRSIMSALIILLHNVNTQTRRQSFKNKRKKLITRLRILYHLIQVCLQQPQEQHCPV